MAERLRLTSDSEARTIEIGRACGKLARRGDLFSLCGPLGAGKTRFVKGVAAGLGADPELVASPTFVLAREYAGRETLFHCDAYRLLAERELEELGLAEMLETGVVAVEWADRFPEWTAPAAWKIGLAHAGGDQRSVEIRCLDERGAALAALLGSGF